MLSISMNKKFTFELIAMGKNNVEKYHCKYECLHPLKVILNDFIKEAEELYSLDDVRRCEILINGASVYRKDKYELF